MFFSEHLQYDPSIPDDYTAPEEFHESLGNINDAVLEMTG